MILNQPFAHARTWLSWIVLDDRASAGRPLKVLLRPANSFRRQICYAHMSPPVNTWSAYTTDRLLLAKQPRPLNRAFSAVDSFSTFD